MIEGFDTVTLSAGPLAAEFAPALGMAGVSLRERSRRRAPARSPAGALRGARPADPRPARRVAALADPAHDASRVRARLDFAAVDPALLAAFPFPHVLELEAALSPNRLTVTTTVHADASSEVPVAFGFHPYLRLGDVPRERWQIGLPPRRRLVLDSRGVPTGAGRRRPAARFRLAAGGFDDGYDQLAAGAAFSVAGGGRTVSVVLERGYPAGQVYTPPGAPFICFEPMTAPTNALRSGVGLRRVPAGGSFAAVFSIQVERRP